MQEAVVGRPSGLDSILLRLNKATREPFQGRTVVSMRKRYVACRIQAVTNLMGTMAENKNAKDYLRTIISPGVRLGTVHF